MLRRKFTSQTPVHPSEDQFSVVRRSNFGQAIIEYAGMIVISTLMVGGMMTGAKQVMPALFSLLSERNAMALSDAPPLPAADFPASYAAAASDAERATSTQLQLRNSSDLPDSEQPSASLASSNLDKLASPLGPLKLETSEPMALTQPNAPASTPPGAPDTLTVPNLVASPAPAPTPASAPNVYGGPTPAPPPAMAPGPTPAEAPKLAPPPMPVSPH